MRVWKSKVELVVIGGGRAAKHRQPKSEQNPTKLTYLDQEEPNVFRSPWIVARGVGGQFIDRLQFEIGRYSGPKRCPGSPAVSAIEPVDLRRIQGFDQWTVRLC